MKNLQDYLVQDGQEQMSVLGKHMDVNLIQPFINFIFAKSVEWNGEAITEWDFYEIGYSFIMIPKEEKIYRAKTAYEFVETDRITFGVALSIYCINHMAWMVSAQLEEEKDVVWKSRLESAVRSFSEQYYFVRDFVLEDDNCLEGLDISQMLNILD